MMKIIIKRVYEKPSADDGCRILVDRLWPRGVKKEKANIDLWLKEIAPSNELRKWFGHEPGKWDEFKNKYFEEITLNSEAFTKLEKYLNRETITFVYSAKEERYNNAAALKEYMENYISPER